MRLEVFCEDRLGLTRELLDLLVLRSIDLRGIEIDPIGRIYLNFAELEFTDFSSLMAEIRRISGVTDVRTVPWMPSEREHLALSALLEALPEPVLSLDMKSKWRWRTRRVVSFLPRTRSECGIIPPHN